MTRSRAARGKPCAAQSSNDARGIGLSLLAIGIAAHCRGDLGDAEEQRSTALTLFRRTDDGPGTGAAVMQLGYIAADSGRWEEALELEERALGSAELRAEHWLVGRS